MKLMDYDKCTTPTKNPIIVVKENRSKFEVRNKDKLLIRKIQVDGCLIPSDEEKCDWIISIDSLKRALFVELKGCDIDKAISQLESTLTHTRDNFSDYKCECYAVTTRIPKNGPSIQKKRIDFFNKTRTTLNIKNIISEVEL